MLWAVGPAGTWGYDIEGLAGAPGYGIEGLAGACVNGIEGLAGAWRCAIEGGAGLPLFNPLGAARYVGTEYCRDWG